MYFTIKPLIRGTGNFLTFPIYPLTKDFSNKIWKFFRGCRCPKMNMFQKNISFKKGSLINPQWRRVQHMPWGKGSKYYKIVTLLLFKCHFIHMQYLITKYLFTRTPSSWVIPARRVRSNKIWFKTLIFNYSAWWTKINSSK